MTIIILTIALALLFDFLNGQHDAGNAVATSIATRALSPMAALVIAAVCNFAAFLVFGLHVAGMIGGGIVSQALMGPQVVLAALISAIIWNTFTLRFGMPSSSSHALIGGIIGSGIAAGGLGAIHWKSIAIIASAIVISPAVGMVVSMTVFLLASWIFRKARPRMVTEGFKRLQIVTCALLSLSHGGNDAQKTMGLIAALLFSQGYLGNTFHVPLWVVLACQTAIAAGTLLGGQRVVGTMGRKITAIKPVQGACADIGSTLALSVATFMGVPVSSTHTITGGIIGAGASRRMSAVRWHVTRTIVVAWFLTIPAAAAVGFVCLKLVALF
ncbi:inorganic phosphate transporter [Gluconobacter potus]|uniref:Inorganic phosphate transporter n=1 Tax=Gluconobacter potus TaxID=2724927 RepID=A0A149QSE4_9PROT|nr:inorganic phosphate transporter [Gluconobacter potus]KXV00104.1 inorganic phosphate transporter [Gluconobacter potus]